VLRSKPLRELTVDDLGRYSFDAISTWGTVEQFKYLLPRLFQVVVEEDLEYCPEVLFNKPRMGSFQSWPEIERAALYSYCDGLWRYALAHHPVLDHLPSFTMIEDCLCSIGQLVDDLIDRKSTRLNSSH